MSDIEVAEHPNYRTINVSGIIAGHQPMSFQMIFYSEELDCNEALADRNLSTGNLKAKRTLECRLFMDPYTAKIVQSVINTHIENYEKKFGLIPTPEELNAKLKEGDKQNSSNVYT